MITVINKIYTVSTENPEVYESKGKEIFLKSTVKMKENYHFL